MISYAILVSDEYEEFKRLITQLVRLKDENDEIVVVVDSSKTNESVKTVLANNTNLISYYERDLGGDFSAQKNFLFEKCTKQYVINLDADELIDENFIKNVKDVLLGNPDIEAYWVPRWNEVKGITDELIQVWGWRMDNQKRINWPDLQMRIIKNNCGITWINPVHEQMNGYKTYAVLPLEKDYCIYHIKSVEKQIQQNNFYNNIVNK